MKMECLYQNCMFQKAADNLRSGGVAGTGFPMIFGFLPVLLYNNLDTFMEGNQYGAYVIRGVSQSKLLI